MNPNPQALACLVVKTQIDQSLPRVVVGFAAGNDAVLIMRALNDVVVQAIGANVSQSGVPFEIKQTCFLLEGCVGPANVHATWRHFKIRQCDLHAIGVNVSSSTGLDNFLNGLHARPNTCKSAEPNGMHAQVQHFLHGGWKENRQTTSFEDVITLVCSG